MYQQSLDKKHPYAGKFTKFNSFFFHYTLHFRRETLADLARSLPWGRQTTQESGPTPNITTHRKRRESSADSGIKSSSSKSRRDSHHTAISDFRTEVFT